MEGKAPDLLGRGGKLGGAYVGDKGDDCVLVDRGEFDDTLRGELETVSNDEI